MIYGQNILINTFDIVFTIYAKTVIKCQSYFEVYFDNHLLYHKQSIACAHNLMPKAMRYAINVQKLYYY